VLAVAQQRAPVDPARIALTGSSNGGMMALKYACERADVVASVAVVAGPLVAPCDPGEAVDVLLLHGELDGVVPVGGGEYPPLGVVFPAVEASLAPFRAVGGDVQLRVLPGAGHGWMTVEQHGLDATTAVWEWARDHPRT
jgi:polyhydroxybutyrate depolymerase